MTCFSWCGYVIDWEAWAAIGSILGALATFIAAYIALWLPRKERQIKTDADKVAGDIRMKDAATMMLPMAARTYALLVGVTEDIEATAFPLSISRTAAQTFYFTAFDELRQYLIYFDVFPAEVRTIIAELIGWGSEWNSTINRALLNDDGGHLSGFSPAEIGHLKYLHTRLEFNAGYLDRWCRQVTGNV